MMHEKVEGDDETRGRGEQTPGAPPQACKQDGREQGQQDNREGFLRPGWRVQPVQFRLDRVLDEPERLLDGRHGCLQQRFERRPGDHQFEAVPPRAEPDQRVDEHPGEDAQRIAVALYRFRVERDKVRPLVFRFVYPHKAHCGPLGTPLHQPD